MPKISSTGEPSYADHTGVVTNAVGEQWEVDPTRELDGERKDGYVNEPVGEFEQSSPPGLAGPIAPVTDGDDENEPDNETPAPDRTDEGRDSDQRPRNVDHRQSEAQQSDDATKRTAAKKSAPAATQK